MKLVDFCGVQTVDQTQIILSKFIFKRINSTVKGDYGICLDNTYSTLTSKTVFLEVAVDSENEQHKLEFEKDWVDLESPQKIIHAKLDDFTAVKVSSLRLFNIFVNIAGYIRII